MNNEKTVSLQKLVAQPECLKLLILHTPYTLQISTLIKLDLSKNNLQEFPCIGNLQNLKFMFIHDNKLDFPKFRNIFLKEDQIQTKSPLMKSIVWVTFWGNKNGFLGRHFIANQTNALVFDRHMIVPQQRKQAVIQYSQEPFCQKSNVQSILANNKILGKNATQQQYMEQFWQQMRELRQKQQQLYPIIKVQKVFRGWMYRQKIKRKKQQSQIQFNTKKQYFKNWLLVNKRQNKLYNFLHSKNKEHWLLSLKQMKYQQISKTMIELARKAKQKIILRKVMLNGQFKFYRILLANLNTFKSLYNDLQLHRSSYVLINESSLKYFKKYIIPFLQSFNGQNCLTFESQSSYQIRQVYDRNNNSRQFIKIISTNKRSYVIKHTKDNINQNQNWKKSLLSLNHNYCHMFSHQSLKPLYQKVYFSKSQTQKLDKIYSNLIRANKIHEEEFVVIKANERVLKDVVRGVYYYNTRTLGQREQLFSRVHKISCGNLYPKKLERIHFSQKSQINHKKDIQDEESSSKDSTMAQKLIIPTQIKFQVQGLNPIEISNIQRVLPIIAKILLNFININSNCKLTKFVEQHTLPYINYNKKIITLFWNQSNSIGKLHFNQQKLMFDSKYISKLFKWNEQMIKQKFIVDEQMDRVQLSHLFHFNTMVSTVKVGLKQTYLRIQCESVFQCKFRIFGLLLTCYQFKNRKFIPIINSELFNSIQNEKKKDIINQDAVFITQGSVTLQQGKQKQIQKYECKVRLYTNLGTGIKPSKLQQNILIFIPRRFPESKIQKEQIQVRLSKEPKLKIQNYLVTEPTLDQQYRIKPLKTRNRQPKQLAPHEVRKIKVKKSVKSFKMERKNKEYQPSFILDNSSVKQRLMTQPDLRQKQTPLEMQDNLLYYQSQIKQKVKRDFQTQKQLIKRRKNDDSFTNNFVNLNNFIQHQYLSQQRRRIKTEIQADSYQSVDRIKHFQTKASQKLVKIKQNQLKKIHQKHQQHKELLFRNQALKKQMTEQLKKQLTKQKEKQNNNKGNKSHVRKLKVSFAQQCFPIANRGEIKSKIGRSESII